YCILLEFRQSKTVSGIPVLFIPGNVGSARQVRSLGSVLQNKTESRFTSFSFNVFAVDFNEVSHQSTVEKTDIYIKMRRSWKQRYRKSMPLISIFGGLKDTLVSEHLSVEPGIQHFFTAGIDSVEAETDHLCIVWCNQLVR
uniref:Hydrolase_4 domain-containing protein n=1 Tax=Syphacia muris TaxID=451379 RepID=A0A0N5ASX7_9BILA